MLRSYSMPSSIKTRQVTGFLSLWDTAGACCCCCCWCRGRCCFVGWESVYSVSSCCSLVTKPSLDSLPDVSFASHTHTHTHTMVYVINVGRCKRVELPITSVPLVGAGRKFYENLYSAYNRRNKETEKDKKIWKKEHELWARCIKNFTPFLPV